MRLFVYGKIFNIEYYPYRYFLGWALWADSVSLLMNTVMSRDQFQPIQIVENLVVNYKY